MTTPFSEETRGGLARLVAEIRERGARLDRPADWPADSLQACALYGLPAAFLPSTDGAPGTSERSQLALLQELASGCLTTAFIYTQFIAACRRLSRSGWARERLMPALRSGASWATVGISHLSTSRQHTTPPLRAHHTADGWRLDGHTPWVTGAAYADWLVVGATADDGGQLLFAVERAADSVVPGPGLEMLALSASCTDRVHFHQTLVADEQRLAGPVSQVLLEPAGRGGGVGGLATSALALGLSRRAIDGLIEEQRKQQRPSLQMTIERLGRRMAEAETQMDSLLLDPPRGIPGELRTAANQLALDSSQALLTAAKGEGFRWEHPAARLVREALFFLVWSCPMAVADAHLCSLGGQDGPDLEGQGH